MVATGERAKAMAEGLTYYFTGQPCSRGHIAKRITANGICHDCFLEDKQKRRAKKPGYRTRAEMDAEKARPTRQCSACWKEFPPTSEHFVVLKKKQPSGTITYGLSRECRTCRNKRYPPYYRQHREEIIKRAVASVKKRRLDPEFAEKDRKWSRERKRRRFTDPDERAKATARDREWRKQNPDRVKLFKHLQPAMRRMRAMIRYVRVLNATMLWLTKEHKQWIETIYFIADYLTRKTGIRYDVDHYYPLKNAVSCGLHVPWNLRVITHEDNQRKGNRMPDD